MPGLCTVGSAVVRLLGLGGQVGDGVPPQVPATPQPPPGSQIPVSLGILTPCQGPHLLSAPCFTSIPFPPPPTGLAKLESWACPPCLWGHRDSGPGDSIEFLQEPIPPATSGHSLVPRLPPLPAGLTQTPATSCLSRHTGDPLRGGPHIWALPLRLQGLRLPSPSWKRNPHSKRDPNHGPCHLTPPRCPPAGLSPGTVLPPAHKRPWDPVPPAHIRSDGVTGSDPQSPVTSPPPRPCQPGGETHPVQCKTGTILNTRVHS